MHFWWSTRYLYTFSFRISCGHNQETTPLGSYMERFDMSEVQIIHALHSSIDNDSMFYWEQLYTILLPRKTT